MKKVLFCILICLCLSCTKALNPVWINAELSEKEAGAVRTFYNLMHVQEAGFQKPFVIAVMNKDIPVPYWDWQDNIDYFLLYTDGYPKIKPHTVTMHFEFVSYTLETRLVLYRATNPHAPKDMYSKPCAICKRLTNVLDEE